MSIPNVQSVHATGKQNASRRMFAARVLAVLISAASLAASIPVARADAPAPTRSAAKYETRFLEDMIDHHFMAVQMAQLCQERAVHAELLELCQQIEAAQMQEIEQMQSWLQAWYGITYEPQMSPSGEQQMDRLASLSGAEFEIEFLKTMIKHHWKAVREGAQCVDRAYHDELVALCENIVMTQTEEIRQMQEWLCSWYDICDYGPQVRAPRR